MPSVTFENCSRRSPRVTRLRRVVSLLSALNSPANYLIELPLAGRMPPGVLRVHVRAPHHRPLDLVRRQGPRREGLQPSPVDVIQQEEGAQDDGDHRQARQRRQAQGKLPYGLVHPRVECTWRGTFPAWTRVERAVRQT